MRTGRAPVGKASAGYSAGAAWRIAGLPVKTDPPQTRETRCPEGVRRIGPRGRRVPLLRPPAQA
jgi:hypothetical protein